MNNPQTHRGFTVAMSVSEAVTEALTTVEKPFGHALIAVARQNPNVVGLTADLGKYTDIDIFGQEFPHRYFQMGMAEQNLIGVAAGLSRVGYIPFATTYCVFATRRAYDFIAVDIALGRANVKIIAGLPGLTTGYGATHQGIDDLALMRAIPNMVVIDPCDATEIQQVVPAIAEYGGPVYMRILRGQVKQVLDPKTYRFELGKAKLLRQGRDLTLISTGLMTQQALQAADLLKQDGIEATVLHVPTLKPLDQDAIIQVAEATRTVLTLENHSVLGGLGSAVAETLCMAGLSVTLAKIGIPDQFVECGSIPYLTDKYGLSTWHVIQTAKEILSRRK
ncbi:MAG TPA: transketolase C-terminal domain-containing protein [Candidatus Limnocylindrales bacterium]|nr:transketolase C-terminal domain-containing protein [Candidatus Limnocylindrales bacterium]